MHDQEIKEFNDKWEYTLYQLSETSKKIEDDLHAQHKKELVLLEEEIEAFGPAPLKFSSKLLDKKYKLRQLIKIKDYTEAKHLKEELLAIEEKEVQIMENNHAKAMEKLRVSKRKKQETEYEAVKSRLEKNINSKLKQRMNQYEKMLLKIQNVHNDMMNKQSIEFNRIQKIHAKLLNKYSLNINDVTERHATVQGHEENSYSHKEDETYEEELEDEIPNDRRSRNQGNSMRHEEVMELSLQPDTNTSYQYQKLEEIKASENDQVIAPITNGPHTNNTMSTNQRSDNNYTNGSNPSDYLYKNEDYSGEEPVQQIEEIVEITPSERVEQSEIVKQSKPIRNNNDDVQDSALEASAQSISRSGTNVAGNQGNSFGPGKRDEAKTQTPEESKKQINASNTNYNDEKKIDFNDTSTKQKIEDSFDESDDERNNVVNEIPKKLIKKPKKGKKKVDDNKEEYKQIPNSFNNYYKVETKNFPSESSSDSDSDSSNSDSSS